MPALNMPRTPYGRGRSVLPTGLPAWLTPMPVGFQWNAISGTSGPGAGLLTDAYGDLVLRPSDSSLIAAAQGGHNDGSSNAGASIRLLDDAPVWVTRFAGSGSVQTNVNYYADGRPTSRHGYSHTWYIASRDAVLLAGCRFGYGGDTPTGPGMDLFDLNPAVNDYSARYTFPDITPWPAAGYGVAQDGAGNIWTTGGYKFDVSTLTWSKPGSGSLGRCPVAYDSIRDRLFTLLWGDGEGFGSGLTAIDFNPNTGNSSAVTFNASAAYSAFTADAPSYAAMAFCPLDGRFYFIHPGRLTRAYVVTPNAGTVWDMAVQEIGGATPTLRAGGASLCKRLHWVPALSGFVLQSSQLQNLYFMRMA